ncbi:MAG TPA: amino acid adenylation domain-containing protein [Chloroflexota bacterium]|nr:amino acid adenylation domain-containing protein [Chloroflexota bacterium]
MSLVSEPTDQLSPAERRALLAALLRSKAEAPRPPQPLSCGQQALWLVHRVAPDNPAYNEGFTCRLSSAVDVPALRRALQSLVDRHPALRTTYGRREGKPVRLVDPKQELCFGVADASGWDDKTLDERLVAEVHRPFDLERGPILRVGLFSRSADDHVLLLTAHHIAVDGWSLAIMLDELLVLYQAAVSGAPMALAPPRSDYSAFVRWQSEMLAGPEGERLWAYWREQLAGPLPLLNLPTDRPRSPVRRSRGGVHRFSLDQTLSRRLKALARAEATTLYTVLLAGFQVLLHRYSGQDDLIVGTPTIARARAEFMDVVGYFANAVPLRANLAGNHSFRAFLRQVHGAVLGALDHQDYPFSLMVERLLPRREPSRSPLFDVSFALQKTHRFGPDRLRWAGTARPEAGGRSGASGESAARFEAGGMVLSARHLDQQVAKFDLELEMLEAGESVDGWLKHDADLFDAATVARMADHLANLLDAAASDPEQGVAVLPLLSPSERHRLLYEWTATAGVPDQGACIHELFEAQAARRPDAVALVCDEQELSYGELDRRANQLGSHLRSLGVGPDVIVGMYMERSIEMLIGILGVLKAGGAYLPLDPAYPKERLAFMLEDAKAAVLLTQSGMLESVPEYAGRVLCLDRDWATIAVESPAGRPSGATPDSLAYVIYTSGSTGKPKGVLVDHRNVVRLFSATEQWFRFDERDVWTLFHSYAFGFSVWEIWGALLYGGTLVVVPYWVSRSPEAFHDLLGARGVTVLNQTPSAFRQLMRVDEARGKGARLSLRLVIFGGEALETQTLRPWFERHGDRTPQLVNMYGITETTVHVTYRPLGIADLELGASSLIGCAIPDLQLYILDPYRQPVPVGVPGEMYVGGAGLARGYLNRPELSAERFVGHPFADAAGARLYRSGDLARRLPNGDIEFLGRIDHQVKIRGFRIELGEIEAVLDRHPAVRESVVLAREAASGDKRLVAYVVPAPDRSATVGELRGHLREHLPEYMVPSAIVQLERLPLTTNGKVDRPALPDPDAVRAEPERAYVAPRSDLERAIAGSWQVVLGIDRVGAADNFFDLGGNSLLMAELHGRLQEALGREIPMVELFQHPTVGALAARLAQPDGGPSASRLGEERGQARAALMVRRRAARQQS